MRKFYALLAPLFAFVLGQSQTTLVNSTFETNDPTVWSFANDKPNEWIIGSATANGGARSVYISHNNGNTNDYITSQATVSHVYRSVTFPAGQGAIILSFDVKGIGEVEPVIYDYVRVSLTNNAPVAGTMPSTTEQLPVFLSGYANFNRVWVAIPSSYAGTTRNLVFTFRSGSQGGYTAFALDNVRVTSAAAAPLSGTKTIKTSGGTYAGFGEAIANLNAHGVGGALTFNVDAGTIFSETPTAITAGGTLSDVVFQKAGVGTNPKIVATGTANNRTTSTGTISTNTDAVLAIVGGDRIVFDGIDVSSADYVAGKSAIEYGIYVYNASATNGSQSNAVRNAAITLNRANTESRAILQEAVIAPTSVAGANSNNKYHNLVISNVFAGIELSGNAAFPDLNTEVGTTACTAFNVIGEPGTANDIGNGALPTWGIRAVNQSTAKIFNNKVTNITTTGSGALSPVDGILVESFLGNTEVYNNTVSGIFANNAASTSSASGINLVHPAAGTHTLRLYNNFISNISHAYSGAATVNRYIRGIFVSGTGGTTAQVYFLDFNSVRIDGSASPNASSAALEVSTTSGPVYFIRNNVLSNFTGAQGATARHFAFVSTSATRVGNTGSVFTYNDIYVPNDAGTSGFLGRGNTSNYTDLASFQSNFAAAANNLSLNPSFVSAADLHVTAGGLNAAADPAYASATPWVNKDIDCDTRAVVTDIGADEFTPPTAPCTAPANPTGLVFSAITAGSASGSFTAPPAAPTGYLVVRSTGALNAAPVHGVVYSVGNTVGNGTVVSSGSATSFDLAGLAGNTAYIITVFAFNNTACQNGPAYNTVNPLTGTVTTCPATPGVPAVTGLSANSFSLSFGSSKGGGASAVSYGLEVAADAAFSNPVSGSPFAFADTTTVQSTMVYAVQGLSANTTYYYRLKAGGCNAATVSGSVTTSCSAVAVPYAESFESIAVNNTLPACMSASPAVAAGGKTQTYTAAATATNPALVARTGSKFAAVYFNSANTPGYFFTAPLQLTGGVTYTASVWYKTDGAAWTDAGLYFGTAPTTAGMTNTIVSVSDPAATAYTQISGSFTPPATGVYYIGIRAFNATSSPNYLAFDDVLVTTAACTAPVVTSTSAVSHNSATINWNAAVPAPASYEVYYSTSSAAPTAATAPTISGITTTTQTITGLSATTVYYAWVRSNCGSSSVSPWSAANVSFTTLCPPVNVPYSENFDAAVLPGLPGCTTREDVNKDGTSWFTATAPTGYLGKVLQYDYNVANAANDWFYTTGINLTAGTSYTLSFRYGNNSTLYVEKLRVAYGNNPSAAAMTNTLQNFAAVTGGTPSTGSITFTPTTSGVYYIGFYVYSEANQFSLYLDNILLDAALVACATPQNVAAGSVTATSASVSWTGTGSFVLEYGPAGFTPGTGAAAGTNGTVINPAANPQAISSLTPGTAYDVYVRRNCTSTGNGYSSNSAKVSFTTLVVNDEVTTAVSLTHGVYAASCAGTRFTTISATPSPQVASCAASAQDDDIWVSFVATNTKAVLKLAGYASVSGTAGGLVYSVYTGSPASLSEFDCDASAMVTTANGAGEIALRKPLVVGQTYYVRLFTAGTGGRASFNLCVMTPDVSASATPNTCVPANPVTINATNANTNAWVPVYTADGKLVAEINANGNNLGTVTANLYRNTNAVRKDNAGRPYLDRNIAITPSVQPTTPVSVRLYFTAAEYTQLRNTPNAQVASIGDLSVFKNNQACSGLVNGAAFPLPTTNGVYESNYFASFNVPTFSSFFIASNSFGVLPVQLLQFSGVRQGSANLLRWTVAQEQDILAYEVERSDDNRTWTVVGTMASLGNSPVQRLYSFTDNNLSGTKQYYRLRQVEKNGAMRLSNVIVINGLRATVLTVSGLFPNPAISRLNLLVEAPVKQGLVIQVMDAVGKVVRTQQAAVEAGANAVQLNVTGLAQGTYLLNVTGKDRGQTQTLRFVKE